MTVDDLAAQYDPQNNQFIEGTFKYNGFSRQAFYEMIDVPMKGKKLLDVACGDGFDMKTYEHRGAIVYGIDSSREFIIEAGLMHKKKYLKTGLMERLPYPNNSFDIITCKYAIQTTLDLAQTIREMTRVLKPKGHLFYLATDPIRQFMEKKKKAKDYFHQDIVQSRFFEGKVTAKEPSHTFNEYLSDFFLENYRLLGFKQYADFPSAERIDGLNYPCFFIIKAQKLGK